MGPRPRPPLWLTAAAAGAAVVLLLGAVVLTLSIRPQESQPGAVMTRVSGVAAIGGPFTLVDQDGQTFTEADLRGRPTLIYFGYTYCPDVCPLSLQVMNAAISRLPERKRDQVRSLFISVDPERDTVERLKLYAGTPGFPQDLTALTGTEKQVEEAKQVWRIYSARGEEAGDFYLVDHTSLIYLLDDEGNFHAAFGHSESPDTIAASLNTLIS